MLHKNKNKRKKIIERINNKILNGGNNMKKIYIVIFVIILILAIGITICIKNEKQTATNEKKNDVEIEIIKKADLLYGHSKCECPSFGDVNYVPLAGGPAITEWTCKLCNKEYENSNTAVPEMCYSCSVITNRCNRCAGLLHIGEE